MMQETLKHAAAMAQHAVVATPENIAMAAEHLRAGDLVAFPTETVYGLGANALDATAVARIFAAKRRPHTSPLIVHIADPKDTRFVVRFWPHAAELLARRFWPGPLTLVLPKMESIPDIVSGGLDTVGVRLPEHPVARALIRAAGVPLAAPSANEFMQLSPTAASHVARSLGNRVAMILDGGNSQAGIESTVVAINKQGDVSLLRPGAISRTQIEQVLGTNVPDAQWNGQGSAPSPGLHERHYAPRTPLYLRDRESPLPEGSGALLSLATPRTALPGHVTEVVLPGDPASYAQQLYAALHRLDQQGHPWIALESPPRTSAWEAVNDRLRRAASR
ncbi:MAG: L-threonylcarbamoyladenylate synthase [Lysobacteraceae bacterium]